MSQFFDRKTLSTGAAIFSMFFGAGNAVFPIALGLGVGENLPYALLGLLLTGIGGPLLGLLTALRYEGDSRIFYSRWGRVLGFIFLGLSLALLGPFSVLPRCFIVAHAAAASFIPGLSPLLFFTTFGTLVLLCTLRKRVLLTLLGYILAPMLLASLSAIIISGFVQGGALKVAASTEKEALLQGISSGYDTMDLIAAIIFSSSIWTLLTSYYRDKAELYAVAWKSSLLGGALLGFIYCGLALVTALHADSLAGVPPEALLTTLAITTLGPQLAGIANLGVILACFTTVISLVYAIASICRSKIFADKLDEGTLILVMTGLTVFFATFGFSTIQAVLHPLVATAYPVIITLTILNLWRPLATKG